jgi:hypothetical protein
LVLGIGRCLLLVLEPGDEVLGMAALPLDNAVVIAAEVAVAD